ncbi:MAG: hypothetical protein BZ136_09695 [Methanosphaera sp. rholeuAM74]|nr:MAG: hypothetical protein BZ136_09695 [Methanosphaera sp. rholeuAM74]
MPDEHVTTVLPIRNLDDNMYLIMATKRGIVKRTLLSAFSNIRKVGLAAINLREDDELIEVKWDNSGQDLMLVTREGMSIRFNSTDIRPMGRSAAGVHGMRLQEGDEVVNMMTEYQGSHVLFISANGLGKLTAISEFKTQHRGGTGVKCYRITEKSGPLVGARAVNETDEILLITTEGVVIRTSCSQISILGRITTGVKIMDLSEGVTIASFSKVKMSPESADAEQTDEELANAERSEAAEKQADSEQAETEQADAELTETEHPNVGDVDKEQADMERAEEDQPDTGSSDT